MNLGDPPEPEKEINKMKVAANTAIFICIVILIVIGLGSV